MLAATFAIASTLLMAKCVGAMCKYHQLEPGDNVTAEFSFYMSSDAEALPEPGEESEVAGGSPQELLQLNAQVLMMAQT